MNTIVNIESIKLLEIENDRETFLVLDTEKKAD